MLHMQRGLVCLSVLDEGPGVPVRNLPHIFERGTSFRDAQSEKSLVELALAGAHQGLGLWIVKRNVEALGGAVSARNRARGGFEIVVCLPGED